MQSFNQESVSQETELLDALHATKGSIHGRLLHFRLQALQWWCALTSPYGVLPSRPLDLTNLSALSTYAERVLAEADEMHLSLDQRARLLNFQGTLLLYWHREFMSGFGSCLVELHPGHTVVRWFAETDRELGFLHIRAWFDGIKGVRPLPGPICRTCLGRPDAYYAHDSDGCGCEYY